MISIPSHLAPPYSRGVSKARCGYVHERCGFSVSPTGEHRHGMETVEPVPAFPKPPDAWNSLTQRSPVQIQLPQPRKQRKPKGSAERRGRPLWPSMKGCADRAARGAGEGSVSGHVATHDREVGVGDGRLIHELAIEHDDHAVGQLEQLVEILADEENRRAAVAGPHHLRADLRDGRDVETETGVGSDQHFNVAG